MFLLPRRDWRLAFALSAMVPVMSLAGGVYYSVDTKSRADSMARISEGANLAEEVFSAVRTVYAYGSQQRLSKLYDVSNLQARKEANKGVVAGAITMSVYYFAFYAGYALAIFFGTMLVYQGKATVGDVIACMEAVVIGALSIALIGPQTQAIQGATSASAKILPTIWRVPPIDSASQEGKRPTSVRVLLHSSGKPLDGRESRKVLKPSQ
jgi:ATP-binding cassette subfamily B (MDR/TAP) protein 1